MWGRLDFSLRRYEQLPHGRDGANSTLTGAAYSSWLRDEVCPTVQQLILRPDFRRLACWPLDHLQQGARTPERRLIEAVECELLAAAGRLIEIMDGPGVREALAVENRALAEAVECAAEEVVGAAEPVVRQIKRPARVSVDDSWETSADLIATRPWRDLMSIYDYFGPAAELNLEQPEAGLTQGERRPQLAIFNAYFAPDLRLPGDYITRMLRIRIEHWYTSLQRLTVRCQAVLRQQNAPQHVHAALRTCLGRLPAAIRELDAALTYDAQAKLRQACMCLVQVYAACHTTDQLTWLGAAAEMRSGASHFVYHVERRANRELVDRIASSLAELAEFSRSQVPPQLIIQERVDDTPLVLVQSPGRNELYWQGEMVDFDVESSRSAWTMLVALVHKARRGEAVDDSDELGITLKDAKHRLKKYLPENLFTLIKSARGSHRLQLTAEQIFVYPQDLREQATGLT